MAYFTTEKAVEDYINRYTIKVAIQKAQRAAHQAKSKQRHDFWREVEEILKSHIPPRINKAKYLQNTKEEQK
ncbi:hypothetical protein ACE1B4_11225 [Aeromonas veronii]|uniref:hypothetical protein n=1 Tax=Aeromonas veronii TaxID=654 RepID=UPI001116715D|nr:hypothetical protein [Aeromonas veronii]TNI03893.1 hypothetical protein CF135_17545 [Aeromonas veronii]TNJ14772.1 hypothetical protein CF113_14595 [Aeromonas veronii]HDO1310909.1 hypothetical protein [Aeromonas veronii]